MLVMDSAPYNIFYSYARADKDVALLLPVHVRAAGVECIYDEEVVECGDEFQSRLKHMICGSQELLVLVSSFYPTGTWQTFDVGVADSHKIRIAPIRFRVTNEFVQGLAYLVGKSCYDLSELPKYLAQMKRRANRTGPPPPPPTPPEPGGYPSGGNRAQRGVRNAIFDAAISQHVRRFRGV